MKNCAPFQHLSFLKNIEYRKLSILPTPFPLPHGLSSLAWDLSLGDSGFGAASDVSSVERAHKGEFPELMTPQQYLPNTHTHTDSKG